MNAGKRENKILTLIYGIIIFLIAMALYLFCIYLVCQYLTLKPLKPHSEEGMYKGYRIE